MDLPVQVCLWKVSCSDFQSLGAAGGLGFGDRGSFSAYTAEKCGLCGDAKALEVVTEGSWDTAPICLSCNLPPNSSLSPVLNVHTDQGFDASGFL